METVAYFFMIEVVTIKTLAKHSAVSKKNVDSVFPNILTFL